MSEINERIKRCIIKVLELDMKPEEIADDAPLFAPIAGGGLELDSLAAIDIIVALGNEFSIQLDEVPEEAFATVDSLGAYVQTQIDGTGA